MNSLKAVVCIQLSLKSVKEQLQDTGPFLKAFGFGGSFGSAVDEKNEK